MAKDLTKAINWYKEAVKNGYQGAEENLDIILKQGS